MRAASAPRPPAAQVDNSCGGDAIEVYWVDAQSEAHRYSVVAKARATRSGRTPATW